MTIETASVDSVIVYFEERICEEVLDQVQHAYHALKNFTPYHQPYSFLS